MRRFTHGKKKMRKTRKRGGDETLSPRGIPQLNGSIRTSNNIFKQSRVRSQSDPLPLTSLTTESMQPVRSMSFSNNLHNQSPTIGNISDHFKDLIGEFKKRLTLISVGHTSSLKKYLVIKKDTLNKSSIKLYDKDGNVIPIENFITNNVRNATKKITTKKTIIFVNAIEILNKFIDKHASIFGNSPSVAPAKLVKESLEEILLKLDTLNTSINRDNSTVNISILDEIIKLLQSINSVILNYSDKSTTNSEDKELSKEIFDIRMDIFSKIKFDLNSRYNEIERMKNLITTGKAITKYNMETSQFVENQRTKNPKNAIMADKLNLIMRTAGVNKSEAMRIYTTETERKKLLGMK